MGCTVELDVDLEPEEAVLAAYGLINCGDSSSYVIVEPGMSFGGTFMPDSSLLEGPARVQLLLGGALWAEFRQEGNSSTYSAGHLPLGPEQQEWELVVSHPRFGEGRAKGLPPMPGTVLSASLKPAYPLPGGGLADDVLEVVLKDPPGVRNFYEIALLNGPPDSLESVYLPSQLLFAVNDTAFSPPSSFAFADRWLFSDEVGDGDTITIAFSFITPQAPLSQPWLNIRYVSQAYYDYLRSLASSSQEFLDPLEGTKGAYSNFENIFGVFALYIGERVQVEE